MWKQSSTELTFHCFQLHMSNRASAKASTVRTLTSKSNFSQSDAGSQFLLGHDVIVSSSQDIYRNLALEDWIYKNCDFSKRAWPLLLMWRNSPCVVIGRHQNPWSECHLSKMAELQVPLARRNSGGGTVYHDLGNVNCTFFTQRSMYNRKDNLKLICEALQNRWPLDLAVSTREDILLDGLFKGNYSLNTYNGAAHSVGDSSSTEISGTAAKLGRTTAYHHFTVLFEADKRVLSSVLRTELTDEMESKASKSIRSPVKNLKDAAPDINFELLTQVIDDSFRQHYPCVRNPIRIVNANEEQFKNVSVLTAQLSSWDWIFGKCPQFTLITKCACNSSLTNDQLRTVTAALTVRHGVIEKICLDHGGRTEENPSALSGLVGKRFPHQKFLLKGLCEDLKVESENRFLVEAVSNCILRVL